VIEEFEDKWAV